MKKTFTVFVDRDGVINRDSAAYIKNCDEFQFLPGSLEAFAMLETHGFDVIVITNQSIIGRKMVTSDVLAAIFDKLTYGVEKAGGKIKDIFFCPHAPDDNCVCRKPLPGMILSAKEKYNIDIDKSCMIGDSAKDIECGKNAGCGATLLVKTGNGIQAEEELKKKNSQPDYVANDLLDAVEWIIQNNPLN